MKKENFMGDVNVKRLDDDNLNNVSGGINNNVDINESDQNNDKLDA